jgi:integrase
MAAGRKRTGTLVWTGRAWSARVASGPLIALHTDSKELAKVRLAELVAHNAPVRPGVESFREATLRICGVLERDGMRTAHERLSRLTRYAWPTLGALRVNEIRSGQISAVLEAARDAGLAGETIKHLHVDISKVFAELVRDEVLEQNPARAERVRIPKVAKDKRKRALLTDAEFNQFVAYHLEGRERPAGSELGGAPVDRVWRRQLAIMALVSRCFGGLRPSDMHAWTWGDVDTAAWAWADAPRPKTERAGTEDDGEPAPRERLELPEVVAVVLEQWWRAAGHPGPEELVFPKQKHSYARDLRRALLEAGITRAELHANGPRTKQTDFYSFRRAFVTAVAAAGLNAQTGMRLAGHKSMATHQRYNVPEVIPMPASALPRAPEPPPPPPPPPAAPAAPTNNPTAWN